MLSLVLEETALARVATNVECAEASICVVFSVNMTYRLAAHIPGLDP